MDGDASRRRRRTALLVASRSSRAPDAGSATDLASDAQTPADATLRAAPGKRAPPEPTGGAISPEAATRIHARFLAEHPEATGRQAVAGTVIDASGRLVPSGRVSYRRPGSPWRTSRIEHDGTFEIMDGGPGPYDLIASRGNGPVDRHGAITTAGFGDGGIVLRAPYDGTLSIRLASPVGEADEGTIYAVLTRENAEVGTETSGILPFADTGRVEFTGVEPGAAHVLWIHDRFWSTYAHLRDVRARGDDWVVTRTETHSLRSMIRSPELTRPDVARLLSVGVDADLGDAEVVRSLDLTMPYVEADESLPISTFGVRFRPLAVPRIPLRLEAHGYRLDAKEAHIGVTCTATLKPGESILADWTDAR